MLILLPRDSADVVRKKVFQLMYVSNKWLLPDLRFLIDNEKGSIIFLLGFYWLNYTGIPRFTALYILHFLQIQVLWQFCIKQICWHHFPNTIYSLCVSHFGNSCSVSNFFIVTVSVVVCNQGSLMLLLQKNSDLAGGSGD